MRIACLSQEIRRPGDFFEKEKDRTPDLLIFCEEIHAGGRKS
jgi:hypothetical protein